MTHLINFFIRLIKLIKCLFGFHEYKYYTSDYQSNKDVYKCSVCEKTIKH